MFKVQALAVKETSFKDEFGNPVKFYKVSFCTPDGDICYLNTKIEVKRGGQITISYKTSKDGKPYMFIEALA